MDKELKQYLDRRFTEMDAKFATRQDLERVETTLLTEVRKQTRYAALRAQTHAAVLRAIELDR